MPYTNRNSAQFTEESNAFLYFIAFIFFFMSVVIFGLVSSVTFSDHEEISSETIMECYDYDNIGCVK